MRNRPIRLASALVFASMMATVGCGNSSSGRGAGGSSLSVGAGGRGGGQAGAGTGGGSVSGGDGGGGAGSGGVDRTGTDGAVDSPTGSGGSIGTGGSRGSGGALGSGGSGQVGSDMADGPPTGVPATGAHSQASILYPAQATGIATGVLATQASGSVLIVSTVRGDATRFAGHQPTDNKGNTYSQLGTIPRFPEFPNAGAAIYAALGIAGGSGHTVTDDNIANDELTILAVEVMNATRIQEEESSVDSTVSTTHTTPSVTTTGPATLVAVCWPGSVADTTFSAVSNGFAYVEKQPLGADQPQGAMATLDVSAPGTYKTTFTISPAETAVMFLVAVQGSAIASTMRRMGSSSGHRVCSNPGYGMD